ncbi:DUF3077 domain-containing protein [Pseudomonas hefeiensis]|uniref:DUF3077 domain-containing protein n=1 Tax=Pseudomonas hefeiensis TaxID=2738125 RepID=A0ABY9GG45_9PSED|nr:MULTISPECIES: DUF3077 domain-containing protein [unclassified Pseudomonas]WLH14572.1 DUF3077 domain-containing protein [Pseudomonas sp. FP205]WLH97632.1 DUF3077 domain-containing protein [Pseudomonas sp. FP53]WLI41903.1 DUF3077 domain-containing protein [Pseudomonas sp. FP821]
MDRPNNDETTHPFDSTFTSLQDCPAAQRALDYYLKPGISEASTEHRFFDVNRNISAEEALVHACDLLRCAAATAQESAGRLQGSNRDLAFSVVHMIDLVKVMLDRSLDGYPTR